MPLGSWYSQLPPFGWFDREDRPGSAAFQVGGRSIPDSQQGIALPTRGGLGKWYNVTPPGSDRPYPLQQTDIGPAPYTGRGVDISAAGAHQMGYTPKTFPTDANFKVEPIDLTGLGLAAGWNGGVPGENNTAVAEGPTKGRKMPASLYDMFTGKAPLEFNPQDAAGAPSSFADALASRSNSLIGLGMGLLQPSRPLQGENAWTNALQGYMGGAGLDARTAQAAAQLKERQAERTQAQKNFERTFGENQMTEAEKLARASGLRPGTPEHTAFIKTAIQSKTEGDWKVVEVPHPDYPDQKIPIWANARTRETAAFVPGQGAPGTTGVASNPDVFTRGTAPVYGAGGDYAGSPAAALPPSGGGAPTTAPAAAPGRAFPPPPIGSNSKVYNEEMTKRLVKDQAEQERQRKQAGMIDPVKEDINQAIKLIQANPNSLTGKYGQLASYFGGQAGDLSGLLQTVKARVSFDELQKMRAASPTGGALGNVSDKDMAALQAVMGSLEQSRTPETLLYNLDRVDRMRHEIIHGPGTAPAPRFAQPDAAVSSRRTGQQKVKPGYIDPDFPDKIFKGGNPHNPDDWATIQRSGR